MSTLTFVLWEAVPDDEALTLALTSVGKHQNDPCFRPGALPETGTKLTAVLEAPIFGSYIHTFRGCLASAFEAISGVKGFHLSLGAWHHVTCY